jgi:hypothetical protein
MSHLAREPAYPVDNVGLLAAAFIGLVERIVRDDANARRIAVGNVLQALGERISSAVDDVELRRVSLPLAIAPEGVACCTGRRLSREIKSDRI